jgi:cytochrome P450
MSGAVPLASFRFRSEPPSLWTMIRQGVNDVGSVIPASILTADAVQLPGVGAPLVVSSPQLAREVLNDRADHFTRDRFIRRLFRRSWGKGLAAAEGEDWQRQRRAVVPFLSPRAVKDHLAAFARAADDVLDEIGDGDRIELGQLSARIVARVVLRVLVDAGTLADPDAAAADVAPYIQRIAGFSLVDLLPLPERTIDRLHGIDRDPAVRRLRALGERLAKARQDGSPRTDMIALLEGVGPIADNIRGMFPAAMDTTVSGLSWALYALAQHAEWQDRVAGEGAALAAAPGLEQLPITRRVVSEALRLYPPAPLMARSAAHSMELAGHRVKQGQSVLVAIYALHRRPDLWDNADGFDPDRFLPGRDVPGAFLPFGTGPRMCVAAHFAQAEMAVILARVAARFALEPIGAAPQVSLKVTTKAIGGLHTRLRARQA